jgi:hypothetical protein
MRAEYRKKYELRPEVRAIRAAYRKGHKLPPEVRERYNALRRERRAKRRSIGLPYMDSTVSD